MAQPLYREMPPSPDLAHIVDRFWSFRSDAPAAAIEAVLPDGRPEIIVHLGRPFCEFGPAGNLTAQPAALLAGQMTRCLYLEQPPGAGVIAARLKPAGAALVIAPAMSDCADRRITLADLSNAWAGLADQLNVAPRFERQIAIFETYLRRERDRLARTIDPIAAALADKLNTDRRHGALRRAARALDLSGRQIERRFRSAVGLPPSAYRTVSRLRAFAVARRAGASLSDAAVQAGYYDQPHLNRELKRIAGTTPVRLESMIQHGGLSDALG